MSTPARLLIHPIRDVTVVNFNDTSILDAAQVEQIGEQLYELIDRKDRRKLILDFSNVRLLSSAALGVLITLRKKVDKIKGQLVLCGMRPDLKKAFKITRLDKLFTFCRDEEKALATFGITTAG